MWLWLLSHALLLSTVMKILKLINISCFVVTVFVVRVVAYVSTLETIIHQIFHPAANHNLIEILWLKINMDNDLYFVACAYHPPKPKYSN